MWQPATLLTLILCSLLLRPLVGFPHARQALAKSARGDDLISGSDFLSVFIGATVPRSRSAIRRRPDSVTLEESNERYTDTEFDSEYSTSNDPQNTKLESSSDSSSFMPEQENSHQDIGNKELSAVSRNLANDLDSINNAETHKSAQPNDFLAHNVDVEPIGESSITSSRRIEYLSDIDIDKSDDKFDINQRSQTSTLSSSRNSSAPTLGVETLPSAFFINSDPDFVDGKVISDSSNGNKKLAEPENPDHIEDATASPDLVHVTESLEESSKNPQNETHQIVSVRVSSSVARASPQHANKNDDEMDAFAQNAEVKELEGISLVTEEEPAATAIQRSQLSVEESSPSSSVISVRQESSSSVRGSGTIESPLNLQSSPVSYHTSVSTATSGSRIQFYSEPPSYQRESSPAAGTLQSSVVSQPQQHQSFSQTVSVFKQSGSTGTGSDQLNTNSNYDSNQQNSYQALKNQGLNSQNGEVYPADSSRTQKSYEEPQERNYELPEHHYGSPERSYAKPEQNYEVDESVSVVSNGRAHGVQYQSATTPAHVDDTGLRDFSTQPGDPDSKFGVVLEGRNFRKYRVEERTSDGFIVGEYGVVSHDDGSLRGVRYTADGTINPQLIHDALVKFLSL